MYLDHWDLKIKPFRNVPDARFFYHSPTHDSAIAELLYAADETQGAALLAGPFGTGKTLLLKALMGGLHGERFCCGTVRNALMSPAEVVLSCARALGAEDLPESPADVSASLAQYRLEGRLEAIAAKEQKALLVIDDAHVIEDPKVWEALRLVLGFGRQDVPVLTMILAGHGDLYERVDACPGFPDRVVVRTALTPLTEDQTLEYLLHRLSRAGASSGIFTRDAAMEIYRSAAGIPSRINHLADLAMAAAFGMKVKAIGAGIIRMVAEEVENRRAG